MHCQAPSHVAKAQAAGENFKETQEGFSKDFEHNFLSMLKTSHGTKEINLNRFYQEVIADRHHIHLNATKWHSLTDFAKHLSRDGVCRVEEKEGEGLFISWIDDSPEAMKRREALRRKELQDKGDEEREQMLLQAQIARAQKAVGAKGSDFGAESEERELKRQEGEKVKLSFGSKPQSKPGDSSKSAEGSPVPAVAGSASKPDTEGADTASVQAADGEVSKGSAEVPAAQPVSLKFGVKPQPKNVFKNAFAGAPKKVMAVQPKKMSEAERIMKEEIERKRAREAGGPPNKKMRF
jgi:DNA/RNA-binding protein KIN17